MNFYTKETKVTETPIEWGCGGTKFWAIEENGRVVGVFPNRGYAEQALYSFNLRWTPIFTIEQVYPK